MNFQTLQHTPAEQHPDSDLLMRAARAAGLDPSDCTTAGVRIVGRDERWNPLENDGDTFWLALQIKGLDLQVILGEAWRTCADLDSRRALARRLIVVAAIEASGSVAGSKVLTRPAEAEPFGCHCDLEEGSAPDECLIGTSRSNDCVYTSRYQTREQCQHWQPIQVVRREPLEIAAANIPDADLPPLPEPVRMSSDQAYLGFTSEHMRTAQRAGVALAWASIGELIQTDWAILRRSGEGKPAAWVQAAGLVALYGTRERAERECPNEQYEARPLAIYAPAGDTPAAEQYYIGSAELAKLRDPRYSGVAAFINKMPGKGLAPISIPGPVRPVLQSAVAPNA